MNIVLDTLMWQESEKLKKDQETESHLKPLAPQSFLSDPPHSIQIQTKLYGIKSHNLSSPMGNQG